MTRIYFAGSIRGGRNDIELYKDIISYLQQKGEVLTEHVGDDSNISVGEPGISDKEIYFRDLQWLLSCDVVIAEVSTPSLGVGFEIAKAVELRKKTLCLYRAQGGKRLSAMILGCPDVIVKEYQTTDVAKKIIDDFLKFNLLP